MSIGKKNIRDLSYVEIEAFIRQKDEKKFRAKQIYDWLWLNPVQSFDQMLNLSIGLRKLLADNFEIKPLTIDMVQNSEDGTIKSKFKTVEGYFTEGVLIPTEDRKTACVSSQIGCSLSCKFCATGYIDKKRNLSFDEIFDEVVLMNQQSLETFGKKLTNIVYMGMGEPLLNYRNLIKSVEKITDPTGALAMSPRRITVSTAGLVKQIKQLGDDNVKFNLALSLHAANDKKRHEIMPINDTNNIKSLIEALNYFYSCTKNEITFEYILFNNFNDSIEDADELIKIYRKVPCHVINLIEYNPIEFASFSKPSEEKVNAFMRHLEKNRVNARLRRSRGKDIDAACGQLANKKVRR